jgi:hypothetical protein
VDYEPDRYFSKCNDFRGGVCESALLYAFWCISLLRSVTRFEYSTTFNIAVMGGILSTSSFRRETLRQGSQCFRGLFDRKIVHVFVLLVTLFCNSALVQNMATLACSAKISLPSTTLFQFDFRHKKLRLITQVRGLILGLFSMRQNV